MRPLIPLMFARRASHNAVTSPYRVSTREERHHGHHPIAELPRASALAAQRAPATDRQQHRQRRYAGLRGARHRFRASAARGHRPVRHRRTDGGHEQRPHPAHGRRARRSQSEVRHAEPDQPRSQHRRHGPRARQLRRQRGEVRGHAALHQPRCANDARRHQRPVRGIVMSMMNIFNVSGSAISAQSQRLNVVASNLANADAVAGPDGQAYKARQVVFQTQLMGEMGAAGVTVSNVAEDQTPGRRVHDPKHPQADAEGYVTYSNVNAVEEMVNMISASRSYQNNVEVMNTAKTLLLKTLQMGQS